MKHNEAIESLAAERYILDEMPDAERDAFEAHFFDCAECAEAVRDGREFAVSARECFRREQTEAEKPEARKSSPWWKFDWLRFPILAPTAAFALAALVGYQNMVTIPDLRGALQPQELSPTMLRTVRGDAPSVVLKPDMHFFQLLVDLNAPELYAGFRCEFQSDAGAPVLSVNATTTSGTLSLLLPAGKFPDGRYTLKILGYKSSSGAPTTEIESHVFSVLRTR